MNENSDKSLIILPNVYSHYYLLIFKRYKAIRYLNANKIFK